MTARDDSEKERVRQAFAGRLRKALLELGISPNEQTRLQKLFGVSGQAARKWVDGQAIPTATRLPQVARVLGVRRAWLQDGEEPMRPGTGVAEKRKGYHEITLSADEVQLLTAYRILTPELRSALKIIVASLSGESTKT